MPIDSVVSIRETHLHDDYVYRQSRRARPDRPDYLVVLDDSPMNVPLFPKHSWLHRLGLAVTSVLAVVAGFALASLLFTVVLVAGLVAAGWLWWRFHQLARQMRAEMPQFIEGEYTVVPAHLTLEDQGAPHQDRLSTIPPRHDP